MRELLAEMKRDVRNNRAPFYNLPLFGIDNFIHVYISQLPITQTSSAGISKAGSMFMHIFVIIINIICLILRIFFFGLHEVRCLIQTKVGLNPKIYILGG